MKYEIYIIDENIERKSNKINKRVKKKRYVA